MDPPAKNYTLCGLKVQKDPATGEIKILAGTVKETPSCGGGGPGGASPSGIPRPPPPPGGGAGGAPRPPPPPGAGPPKIDEEKLKEQKILNNIRNALNGKNYNTADELATAILNATYAKIYGNLIKEIARIYPSLNEEEIKKAYNQKVKNHKFGYDISKATSFITITPDNIDTVSTEVDVLKKIIKDNKQSKVDKVSNIKEIEREVERLTRLIQDYTPPPPPDIFQKYKTPSTGSDILNAAVINTATTYINTKKNIKELDTAINEFKTTITSNTTAGVDTSIANQLVQDLTNIKKFLSKINDWKNNYMLEHPLLGNIPKMQAIKEDYEKVYNKKLEKEEDINDLKIWLLELIIHILKEINEFI
jgi:hypothetical protein